MNPDTHSQPDRLRRSFSPGAQAAFLSCIITGFLVHLFAFTNIIPNSDGLSRVYDAQQMTISGRWFLHYASVFHGFLQAPALIGILSLIFLGSAAGLSGDLVGLRRRFSGILWGAIFAVFPPIAYNYLYMFTASAYAFGIFLAVLSVWILRRWRWGFLPAALLLACSVGTYQAYLAVAASLGLICSIRDLLDQEPVAPCVKQGIRTILMILVGMILYWGILQVFLRVKDLTLLDYRGIGTAGTGFSVVAFLRSILSACKHAVCYFLQPYAVSYGTGVLTIAHWALVILTVLLLIPYFAKKGDGIGRKLLLLAGFALLPLALNLTQILTEISPNMRYGLVFAYLLPILLMDRAILPCNSASVLRPVFSLIMAVIVLLSSQICNTAYVSSATAHRATQAFATNLVARVEQTPGYRQDMQVVVIGSFPRNIYHSSIEAFDLVGHYSCMADTVLDLNKHVYYYLNDWLNVPWQEPEEQTMLAVSQSDDFQAMPLYPNDGSVAIIDGRVVVKLSDHYTPKKPYELQYEQRR